MAFNFEKLVVYQKSVDFADEICQQTEQFPRGYESVGWWKKPPQPVCEEVVAEFKSGRRFLGNRQLSTIIAAVSAVLGHSSITSQ